MRILLTADPELPVPPPLYGGIERIVDWLARELVAMGHDVLLVANAESTVPGVTLRPWPGSSSRGGMKSLRNALHLRRAVADGRPDVIHSFSRLAYLAPLAGHRVPRIMSFQRLPTARTVAWSARLAGKRLVYTGCSEWICAVGRMAGGTWHAIPNGVETQRYTFVPAVSPDAPLLFLSRLDRVKAPHLAIEVAARAGRRLILAGNIADRGPERDYFEREVKPRLAPGRVEWVGPVDDRQKNELMGSSAALLVPIQWDEPFGIVFAEALACGTPVLACPRGALPEIIRNGLEGFLESTPQGLATAVQRLPEISRAACRLRAETTYSSRVLAKQYSDLYSRLAGRS